MFHLSHEEAKDLIRKAGNKLAMVVERGEMIVPSLNTAFPKPKEEEVVKPKTYSQEVIQTIKPMKCCQGSGEDGSATRTERRGLHNSWQS